MHKLRKSKRLTINSTKLLPQTKVANAPLVKVIYFLISIFCLEVTKAYVKFQAIMVTNINYNLKVIL